MDQRRFALIVAGGSGQRMRNTIPKQFLEIGGRPILYHTIEAFRNSSKNIDITLVLPKSQIVFWKKLCSENNWFVDYKIVEGGPNRFVSVLNGLNAITNKTGLIAIHDGVRPFINDDLISRSYSKAQEFGSSIPCIIPSSSIRKMIEGKSKSVNRSEYRIIQTPQCFHLSKIKKAYEAPFNDLFTDDASVYENAGYTIELIDGLDENIKITRPIDIHIAETFLREYRI